MARVTTAQPGQRSANATVTEVAGLSSTAVVSTDIMDGVADLIVVTGPPGIGKSAVAQVLSKLFEPGALDIRAVILAPGRLCRGP